MEHRLENVMAALPECCVPYMMAKSKELSASSLYMYGVDLNIFFHYLRESVLRKEEILLSDLQTVTNGDISNYLTYLTQYCYNGIVKRNASSAKQRKLVVVRSFFTYMHSNGYMKENPTAGVSVPRKTRKSPKVLEPAEIDRILAFARNPDAYNGSSKKDEIHHRNCLRDYLILVLLFCYQLPVSAVAGLNVQDYSPESLTCRERGKTREIVLLPEHREAFERYLYSPHDAARCHFCMAGNTAGQEVLFYSRKKNRISARNIEVLSATYQKSVIMGKQEEHTPL